MNSNTIGKRPRVWPSLSICLGIVPLLLLVSYAAFYVIVNSSLPAGQDFGREAISEWIEQNRTTAGGFLKMAVPLHVTLLLISLIAAARSRTPLLKRLGLVSTSIPFWHYLVFILGGVGANTIAAWVYYPIISPSEEKVVLSLLYPKIGGVDGAVIVLYLATVGALAEELLYRGFVMRGLLRRWKPLFAIGVSSFAYMVGHANPFFAYSAVTMSLWLALVAWRTGSIWPAIACHSIGTVLLAVIDSHYPDISVVFFDEISFWLMAIGVFCIVMMGVSLRILFAAEKSTENSPGT